MYIMIPSICPTESALYNYVPPPIPTLARSGCFCYPCCWHNIPLRSSHPRLLKPYSLMEARDAAQVACVGAPLADCGCVNKGRGFNVPVTANAGQLQNLRLLLTRPQTANGGRIIADRSSASARSSSVFRDGHPDLGI